MIKHVETIQRAVAMEFGIPIGAMISPRRAREWARPRQVAMLLCRRLVPTLSLPTIGRLFAHRDHTTVLHACRMITGLCQSDAVLAKQVENLATALQVELGEIKAMPPEAPAEVHARRIAKHLEFGLLRLARLNPSEFMTRFAPQPGKPTLIEVEGTLRRILVSGDEQATA